jgi:hypothetical protein
MEWGRGGTEGMNMLSFRTTEGRWQLASVSDHDKRKEKKRKEDDSHDFILKSTSFCHAFKDKSCSLGSLID